MSYEIDSTQTAKQAYLFNEIINKGYDPEQFAAQLESFKPGFGSDINNFSMEELSDNVDMFVKET